MHSYIDQQRQVSGNRHTGRLMSISAGHGTLRDETYLGHPVRQGRDRSDVLLSWNRIDATKERTAGSQRPRLKR